MGSIWTSSSISRIPLASAKFIPALRAFAHPDVSFGPDLVGRLAGAVGELDAAFVAARQIPRLTEADPDFDVACAYEVLAELHARRVEPLDGASVAITSGLQAGDRVATQAAALINQIR